MRASNYGVNCTVLYIVN